MEGKCVFFNFINNFYNRLSRSLSIIINTIDPHAIVFGGGVSNEIKDLNWRADFNPKYVEVAFSNTCNFKCMYCGPQFSSSWVEELKKYGNEKVLDNIIKHGSNNDNLNYYTCPRIWCPISNIPLTKSFIPANALVKKLIHPPVNRPRLEAKNPVAIPAKLIAAPMPLSALIPAPPIMPKAVTTFFNAP